MSRAHELFVRLQADGERAIDQLIADFQSENLWVDFKRSADHGAGASLHQDDRANLAKAMSGFANSDGGVVIWGVDCRKDATGADVPSTKFPVQHPKRFISWLEGVVSSCVTPPVGEFESVVVPAGQSPEAGFVATYIPASNFAPHQCIQPSTRLQYYMRAGSSFVSVPHAVLAGMFGRRPQPHVFSVFDGSAKIVDDATLDISIGVSLVNQGPAPARGAYVSFHIGLPKSHCRAEFKPRSPETWSAHQAYGMFFSVVAQDHFRLPPHMPIQPVQFRFQFAPPFASNYVFEMHRGCDGAPAEHTLVELDLFEVSTAYAHALELLKSKPWDVAIQDIFPTFFGSRNSAA